MTADPMVDTRRDIEDVREAIEKWSVDEPQRRTPLPREVSRTPPTGLALGALALLVALGTGLACHLSPAQEAGILAGAAGACALEAMVPIAGPVLVAACPGEVALLKAALDAAAAAGAAPAVDAGVPVHVGEAAQPIAVASVGAPVYHRRRGHRRRVGHVGGGEAYRAAVQLQLDVLGEADAGAP